MTQTATQWLRKEISKLGTRSRFYHDVMGLIDEAEKKEKGQMSNFANEYADAVMGGCIKRAEQYYNETFNKTQAQ